MSFINGHDYRQIAVQYGDARDNMVNSKAYLFESVYTIVQLNAVTPEVDLLNVFWQTYLYGTSLVTSPQSLLSSVRAINQHVIDHSGYTTIDAYLIGEGKLVPQTWADMSAEVGFTITQIG